MTLCHYDTVLHVLLVFIPLPSLVAPPPLLGPQELYLSECISKNVEEAPARTMTHTYNPSTQNDEAGL